MKLIDNLKLKVKQKLRTFLEIDTLEDNLKVHKRNTERDLFNHEQNLKENLKWCKEQFKNTNEKVDALHNTVCNTISLGADVVQSYDKSGSWAVVCIEGRYNVVKFIDLRGQNGRDILHFLKQFEASRYVHDTPMAFLPKEMFIDWK